MSAHFVSTLCRNPVSIANQWIDCTQVNVFRATLVLATLTLLVFACTPEEIEKDHKPSNRDLQRQMQNEFNNTGTLETGTIVSLFAICLLLGCAEDGATTAATTTQ
jgi:hypothetical protein